MKPVILCIDDEPMVLRSLAVELKQAFSAEFNIETSDSAEEALEFLESLQEEGSEVPLIITDYIMPKMRGDALLAKVHEFLPNTMKVMLSGHSELEGVVNAINSAHLYRFLSKPWQKEDLALTIKEATEKYFRSKTIKEQNEQLLAKNEELSGLNTNLEKLVDERTAELAAKNDELLKLNNVKDKLFSIVSHDIKGPLSSLQSVLFLMSHQAISSKELKTISEEISESVSSTISFLESLLQWSKAQLQGLKVNLKKAEIQEIAQKAIGLVNAEAEKKNITLTNQIPPHQTAYCDAEMTLLIFRNLLNNAVKFTPKEGKVSISAMVLAPDQLQVEVKDSGKGIKAEELPSLFNLEANISTLGTEKEKGTGLGLSLCKDLVERQGGKIWAESMVNKGSSFFFTLPLKEIKEEESKNGLH